MMHQHPRERIPFAFDAARLHLTRAHDVQRYGQLRLPEAPILVGGLSPDRPEVVQAQARTAPILDRPSSLGAPPDAKSRISSAQLARTLATIFAACLLAFNASTAAVRLDPQAAFAEQLSFAAWAIPLLALTTGSPVTDASPGRLAVPAGWSAGDAAVVLTWDGRDPLVERDVLIGGLLRAGFAVLELDVATPRGFSADSDRNPPAPTPADLLHDLVGAAAALRRDLGAGSVAAIGYQEAGEAALLAAQETLLEAGVQLGTRGGLVITARAGLRPQHPMVASLCSVAASALENTRPEAACTVLTTVVRAVP